MAKKIMGFKKFTSRKGTPTCAVSVTEEYSANDLTEHEGLNCFSVLLFNDDCNIINSKSIGRELQGFFGYSNGACFVQSACVK